MENILCGRSDTGQPVDLSSISMERGGACISVIRILTGRSMKRPHKKDVAAVVCSQPHIIWFMLLHLFFERSL